MNLPLAMPKLWREPMQCNNSPIAEDWAKPPVAEPVLEFGNSRVLLRQRRLLAGGAPVEIGARAFDLLMVLIEADGALVTKDDLQNRIWPNVVVAPENLKVQVAALRRALGEDRRLILTDHGRGYRFTATVRSAVAALECSAALGATIPQDRCVPALPTDLSVIASRLARVEVRLAEALNRLGAGRGGSRLPRRRYAVIRSAGRARRRGGALPCVKSFDLAS